MIKEIEKDPELKRAFESVVGKRESSSRDTSGLDARALDMLKKQADLVGNISEMKELEFKAEIARLEEISKKLIDTGDIAGEQVEEIKNLISAMREGQEVALQSFDIEILDQQIEKTNELNKKQRLVNKAKEQGSKISSEAAAKAISDMVGISDYSKSSIGQITTFFGQIADGSEEAKGRAIEFGQEIAGRFSPQALGLTAFTKIFSESLKVFEAYDAAAASLAKTTGTAGKFNNVLYDTQRAGNLLGVEMSDAADAISTLNAETSNFAKLSQASQAEIAAMTSQMGKLGVSASDTAAFMENAFKIMNMSSHEAVEVQKELAMAGVELGIGAGKIVKDFNAASKTLAVYGKNSINIFKDLAAQAKAAGVEVSTLLGIVQKYDTFSGAAEGAAQFNALLGTQLSTTEMLMMTEEERMKTLIESVQAQGIAFGDMDKYTQKAIAAAAGISDMNEANRIFSMSLTDYEANRIELEKNAEAQQKFDDAVQATVPVMKKFQNLATEMITLVQPALEKLGEIADYLTDFFQGLSKETKETVSMFALFAGGIMALVPILSVGSGFMAGLAAIGPAIAGIGTGIAAAATALTGIASTGIGAVVLGGLLAAGAGLAATMAVVAESKAEVAKANAEIVTEGSKTIDSLQEISQADFSGLATNFGAAMTNLKNIASDAKVTATLQNLSLINAGTAVSLTGAKIASSSTNLTTNVSNMFDNMTISLKTGAGKEFEAYIEGVAAKVAVS